MDHFTQITQVERVVALRWRRQELVDYFLVDFNGRFDDHVCA